MEIKCSRCGAHVQAMDKPPIPNETGREVQENVCAACWQEWLRTQVMLINEYRLNLIDPQVRVALEGQMREFLHLAAPAQA
jgi:Fe-S cluster biosynthesis and repair protein YggX